MWFRLGTITRFEWRITLKRKIIAVDFDGTCVTHEFPKIGRFIGAQKVLRRIVESGDKIILYTMRSGKYLDDAVEWFQKNEIPLFGVNENPEQKSWTTSPKVYANIYIDDAALGVPLCEEFPGKRPFVDWEAVEEILFDEVS